MKTGLWIIGAHGSVGSTILTAHAAGGIKETGLITEQFKGMLPLSDITVGGCDIHKSDPVARFLEITNDVSLYKSVKDIKPASITDGITSSFQFDQLIEDINAFKKDLDMVIMVNLASTEPIPEKNQSFYEPDALEQAIKEDSLPVSTLYAYAGIKTGCHLINFTPSQGFLSPAIQQLAKNNRLAFAGNDGKTGETLVKCALAPLFKHRALKVLSWQGYNILGNKDGASLAVPENKASKTVTKDSVLPGILGYTPHTHVGIDYVPSIDDWKIAWDYIHFEGFMGAKMSMQFTWHGCDSLLAAPLVLDLARLVEHAIRNQESGLLRHLKLFFKKPIDQQSSDLTTEWNELVAYMEGKE